MTEPYDPSLFEHETYQLLRQGFIENLHDPMSKDVEISRFLAKCGEDFRWLVPAHEKCMAFERIFDVDSWLHLGPSRVPPRRRITTALTPSGSEMLLWGRLLGERSLRQQVNSALERLELHYKLVLRDRREIVYRPGNHDNAEKDNQIDLQVDSSELGILALDSGIALTLHDVGFGLSTTLPVLVALVGCSAKLISIEQPELHIHPRLQAELGDLFMRYALGPDADDIPFYGPDEEPPCGNNRLLIETHSEHLILRILRRIRETTEREMGDWPEELRVACPEGIRPEDVAVLYVQPGEEGAEVIELPVTADGAFSRPWPGGFFEEQLRELG